MDNVQRRATCCDTTDDSKEAQHNIYGKLEIEEVSDVAKEEATPFNGLVNGFKASILNYHVRSILSNITALTHAEANWCIFESRSIRYAISAHAHQSTHLVDQVNEYKFVFG